MRIYELNLTRLVRGLVPPFLRLPTLLALLGSLVNQVAYLYTAFMLFAASRRKAVGQNGQTMCLTYMLNERFDSFLQDIYILNHEVFKDGIYLSHGQDPEQFYLGVDAEIGGYLATDADLVPGTANFTIYVPMRLASLTADPELRALVDYYKLHGTSYNVTTY